jgi:hypothetical protein
MVSYISKKVQIAGLALASLTLMSTVSEAGYFYWYRGRTNAGGEEQCHQWAGEVMQRENFQSIKVGGLGTDGERDGIFITISCFGSGVHEPTYAVVMARSENNGDWHLPELMHRKMLGKLGNN